MTVSAKYIFRSIHFAECFFPSLFQLSNNIWVLCKMPKLANDAFFLVFCKLGKLMVISIVFMSFSVSTKIILIKNNIFH